MMTHYNLRDAVRAPGLISLARLPLGVLFLCVLKVPAAATSVLVAAGLSDVLDGWVARRFQLTTPTGAVLDALMDKVFVLMVVVALVLGHWLTPLEAVLLGIRDVGELPLVLRAAAQHRISQGPERRANVLGKCATLLQFATLVVVLVRGSHQHLWVVAAAVGGLIAAASYWRTELGRPDPPPRAG